MTNHEHRDHPPLQSLHVGSEALTGEDNEVENVPNQTQDAYLPDHMRHKDPLQMHRTAVVRSLNVRGYIVVPRVVEQCRRHFCW